MFFNPPKTESIQDYRQRAHYVHSIRTNEGEFDEYKASVRQPKKNKQLMKMLKKAAFSHHPKVGHLQFKIETYPDGALKHLEYFVVKDDQTFYTRFMKSAACPASPRKALPVHSAASTIPTSRIFAVPTHRRWRLKKAG